MNYIQYHVPTALQHYVRYFWSFESFMHTPGDLVIRSFADQYPRLIFQDLTAFKPLLSPEGKEISGCYLCGVDTRQTTAVMGSTFSHFGVSFYPHAIKSIFGISSEELTDKTPDIDMICKSRLHTKLKNASSHIQRVSILGDFLYGQLRTRGKQSHMIDSIVSGHDIDHLTDLTTLHHKYKISERQFQRQFREQIGVSAKKFQRIIRFEKSLQLLSLSKYNELTGVAHMLQYTDQSHFIKDFTSFSGLSPYEFVRSKSIGSESASFIFKKSN